MKSIKEAALAKYVQASMMVEGVGRRGRKQEGGGEEGSTTVEYSIGAVATAAFAGLLLAVLKSGGVKAMINNIIQTALSL